MQKGNLVNKFGPQKPEAPLQRPLMSCADA
jgi:hypothetical protein